MKINLDRLTTEQRNENTLNIGNESTKNIVKLINNEDHSISKCISSKVNEIAVVIDQCYKSYINGGRIIYIGAGTSGRLGILDASEIYPTYGVTGKFIGIIAGGPDAIMNPIEGAEDDREQSIKDLKSINFNKNDILIGLTASGRTPYVIEAIKYANSIGAVSSSISTSENSETSIYAKYPIEIVIGPEPITGSTRMRSGTAQKMILNMISTGTMIKVGKIYENLMIDVQPKNEKLVIRCKNIIKYVTKKNDEEIEKIFNKSKSVPLSIIMLLKEVDIESAKKIYIDKDFKWSNII